MNTITRHIKAAIEHHRVEKLFRQELKRADFWAALDEAVPSCKAARAMRRLTLIHKTHRLPFVGYAIWRQGTPYQKYLIDAMEGGSFWRRNYGRFH